MCKFIGLVNLASAAYQFGAGNNFVAGCVLAIAAGFFALGFMSTCVRRQTEE